MKGYAAMVLERHDYVWVWGSGDLLKVQILGAEGAYHNRCYYHSCRLLVLYSCGYLSR